MKALVLAGGLGTRLRDRVPDVPKPMAPVAGRPFLEYLLDRLVRGGVPEIILSVGDRAGMIQAHFGANYRGVALRYAVEPQPLGTGGAIAFALRGEPDAPILVVNGDTLLDIDYGALVGRYQQKPVPVAVVVRHVADVSRYGSVTLEGDRITRYGEKSASGPGFVSAGVYILQPGALTRFPLPEKFSFETDFLQRHCAILRPRTYPCEAYFIDIGIPGDYDRAQIEVPRLALV